MLSNQKSSRFLSTKGMAFSAIALALLMSVTAFASGNSFIDSAREFFGLQTNAASVEMNAQPAAPSILAPCAGPGLGDIRTVSLPTLTATPGAIVVPIIVGDLTNCAVISYDFNVDYDPAVLSINGTGVDNSGTISSAMIVTPNTTNAGHLVVSAFTANPICQSGCVGGETLVKLTFNVIGAPGSSSPLDFADYTDPLPSFHPAFTFNDGDPDDTDTNGSVTVPALPTATNTNTNTPTPSATNTFTPTNTTTPTNTATATATQTNTFTPTPTPLCAQIDIDDKTATNGSSVVIGVKTSDTTALIPQAVSADFNITYDNTILTGVPTSPYGVALGPVGLSNGATLTVNRQVSGSTTKLLISVYGQNFTPFSGAGDLVTITFPTVTGAPGTFTPINFTAITNPPVPAGFWYNEGFPSTCLQNGSVQILGTTTGRVVYDNFMPGAPFDRAIPNVTMNVSGGFPPVAPGLTDFDGKYTLAGFGSGLYTVAPFRSGLSSPDTHGAAISAYDAAITAQFVVQLIPMTSKQQYVANVTKTGSVSSNDSAKMAAWAVNIPTTGADYTGNWEFAYDGLVPLGGGSYNTPGTYTNENWKGYLLGDPSGNWCDPTSSVGAPPCSAAGTIIGQSRTAPGPQRATNVEASRVAAPAGSEVVVPVSVQGVADKGIISYQFDLRYDPTVIQPTANAVTLNGTVSSDMSVVVNSHTPGLMKVAVYGPYALSQAGNMLNFHFTAVGAPFAVSPITWENFFFNEGSIKMNVVDGEVRLTAAAPTTAE